MGGMAPFIPSRKDPAVNEAALARVRDDKLRESRDGFDGTWVAHPDLVPVAMEVFEKALGPRANQKERLREDVSVAAAPLRDTTVPGGTVTEAGFRNNVNVALQYLSSWLSGNGAAAIFNLMEDVATAEIARSQLWQWIHNGASLADGRPATAALYETVKAEELARLGGPGTGRLREAAEILDGLVPNEEFTEFLTLPAYPHLE
jgi:malate synthase